VAAETQPTRNTVELFRDLCYASFRNPEVLSRMHDMAFCTIPEMTSFKACVVGEISLQFECGPSTYKVRLVRGTRSDADKYVQFLFVREPDTVFKYQSDVDPNHSTQQELLWDIITRIREHQAANVH